MYIYTYTHPVCSNVMHNVSILYLEQVYIEKKNIPIFASASVSDELTEVFKVLNDDFLVSETQQLIILTC